MITEVSIDPPLEIYGSFQRFNYKVWTAIAEFVDNSIQSFRDHRETLQKEFSQTVVSVNVQFDSDSGSVCIDDDAAGIPLTEFSRAFRVAIPPRDTTGMNEFGMGMKCAAFWFTDKWNVETRYIKETVVRNISLDLEKICNSQLRSIPVKEEVVPKSNWHGTRVSLKNVSNKRMPKTSQFSKIREFLSDIYRVPIREGYLNLFVNGIKCEFTKDDCLKACFYDRTHRPTGQEIIWKKEVKIGLPGERNITGFAGILKDAKRSSAGFTLFRRGRVVDGFPGNRWMPPLIFGAKNSFASLRIFGELHFEGFGVSSQKDQIDWAGFEDDFCELLKDQLNAAPIALLKQADNYRANPIDDMEPDDVEGILSTAVDNTGQSLQEIGSSVKSHPINGEETIPLPAINPRSNDLVINARKYEIVFDGTRWLIEFQFPKIADRDKWLDVRGGSEDIKGPDGQQLLQIRLALDHPFSKNFLRMEAEHVEPILRLAAALALAERLAKMAGVQTPGVIRSRMNEILTNALGHSSGDSED